MQRSVSHGQIDCCVGPSINREGATVAALNTGTPGIRQSRRTRAEHTGTACYWRVIRGLTGLALGTGLLIVTMAGGGEPSQAGASTASAAQSHVEQAAASDPDAHGVRPTTEWVNLYSQSTTIDGRPIPIGAVVRAYNPRGVLSGAVTVTQAGWYGLLPVYRDDPNTAADEGLRPNEPIRLTIDNRAARPRQTVEILWTSNGDLRQVDLDVTSEAVPTPTAPAPRAIVPASPRLARIAADED